MGLIAAHATKVDDGVLAFSSVTKVIDGFLKSPFSGIAPWVLFSVLSAPGRFEEAVCVALGVTLLVMWVGHRRGIKIQALDWFGALFFVALAVIGLVASDGVISWLEVWAGEITNISLAVFVIATLALRKPFTLPYAKLEAPEEYWDSPLFLHINYVISAVWAGAFTVSAIAGFIGDAVLHDADNFWTGWILQLAALFFAVAFTDFYPDYAGAKADKVAGQPPETEPSVAKLIDWIPTFILVVGIFGWVTDALPDVVGIALIVVGSVGAGIIAKAFPERKSGDVA